MHIIWFFQLVPFVYLARLSKNLKKIFSYDLVRKEDKDLWLIENNEQNEKFEVINMKVKDEYKSKIFPWRKTKQQLEIMLNFIC